MHCFGALGRGDHAYLVDDSFVLVGMLVDQMLVDEFGSLEQLPTKSSNKERYFESSYSGEIVYFTSFFPEASETRKAPGRCLWLLLAAFLSTKLHMCS